MVEFFDGTKDVKIPSELEELTSGQYLFFVALSGLYSESVTMTEQDYRVRWLSYLAGLGSMDYTLLPVWRQFFYEKAMGLTDGFFCRGEHGRLLPRLETPANLLRETGGYRGPGDWLEGMKFGEFTHCLSLLGEAARASDGADHEQVMRVYGEIARVMYGIPEGDPVPDILYFHAPTLFRSVLKRLGESPVEVNGEAIDFRILFRSDNRGSRRVDDKTGWAGVTFEVASSGVFGGVKEVEKTDFWMVLLYLYRCKFEYLHRKT